MSGTYEGVFYCDEVRVRYYRKLADAALVKLGTIDYVPDPATLPWDVSRPRQHLKGAVMITEVPGYRRSEDRDTPDLRC